MKFKTLIKSRQQSLLEVIENGSVTLIASTTENPYFYVYNAILSRSAVFEFKPLEVKDILKAIRRGVCILEDELKLQIEFSDFAFAAIAETCGGDVRKALNTLEMCVMSAGDTPDGTLHISVEMVEQASSKKAFRHDRDGDSHYDVLSAFQKSIRGSEPGRGSALSCADFSRGRFTVGLPQADGNSLGGHWFGVSGGGKHCKSLCGQRVAGGPSGSADSPLPRSAPFGNCAKIKRRYLRH